jgi:uncharacterized Fe-S cluster-containing radical SAM superfamily protein
MNLPASSEGFCDGRINRDSPMTEYPRCVTPASPPFDPLQLAETTLRLVCRERDAARKYTEVYVVGVYGGIATAYAVGCPLRCIFCWVDDSREYPEHRGHFYTPSALVAALEAAAQPKGIRKARISGAEPTLCKAHLLQVLPLIEESSFETFILETNGMLFGADPDYVRQVAQFKKVYIRVSLKAGTPDGFQRRTGALGDSYRLPYQAIQHLLQAHTHFHVAAMTDSRLMPPEERSQLVRLLGELDPRLVAELEEEVCDPYRATKRRLAAAGVDPKRFFGTK